MNDIDLNLLAAFNAIYAERNVSRAATSIGLSQPAMSNALRRLREALNDPLFVKVKSGVAPTPFADEMAPTIREALALLDASIKKSASFDASQETRTFTLAMSDVAEISILPNIVKVCKERAPKLRLRTKMLTQESMHADLETGTLDLCIGFIPDAQASAYQQTLFTTNYVCLARKGHPAIGQRLSRKAFVNAEHIVASADATGHAALRKKLEKLSSPARISIETPHFFALPYIVAATDCLALCPRTLLPKVDIGDGIRVFTPPIPLPAIEVRMFWHERVHRDPANLWMRETIRDAFARTKWD